MGRDKNAPLPLPLPRPEREPTLVRVPVRAAVAAVRRFAGPPRGRALRGHQPLAAARPVAVVDALEQAEVGVGLVEARAGAVEAEPCGAALVAALLVEAELGLDGGAVDAKGVEALSGAAGELHVLLAAVGVDGEGDLEVHARDDFGVGELPDVDMVAADDAGEGLDVLADVLDVDVVGRRLQENTCRGAGQGDRRLENNGGDEERDGGVGVVLAGPFSEPDDERRYNYTQVPQSVAYDVKYHGVHAHVVVAVSVAALLGLVGKSMVVPVVHARVSPRPLPARVSRLGRREGAVVGTAAILEQGRVFCGLVLVVLVGCPFIRGGIAVVAGVVLGQAGSDDILSEAGWVDAHVLDASEARMPALAGATSVAAPDLAGNSAALAAGLVLAELDAATAVRRFIGLGKEASEMAGLVGRVGMNVSHSGALFLVVSMAVYVFVTMAVVVPVLVIVAMVVSSMPMSMATQDDETDKVGEETGATDDEDELGVLDLGRLDESGDGFEDDGDAEGDKEDGVEKGTENLGSYPLRRTSG